MTRHPRRLGQTPADVVRAHDLDVSVVEIVALEDTPEPVRPWARIYLALQLELAPYGVQTGHVLADARHGALVAALTDLGHRQADVLRKFWEPIVGDLVVTWPVLDADAVEVDAVRAAIEQLLELRTEIRRQLTAAREEAESAARRAALLEGVHDAAHGHPHPVNPS